MCDASWDEPTSLLWTLVRREVVVLEVLRPNLTDFDPKTGSKVFLVPLMRSQSIFLACELHLELVDVFKHDPLDSTLNDPAKVQDLA